MKFFKYGIDFFDGKLDRYGGHWQFLSRWTQLDYLWISVNENVTRDYYKTFQLKKKIYFKRSSIYYDGYHHSINCVLFNVCWGGKPYDETESDDDF